MTQKKANATRAQKTAEEHERKTKERENDAKLIKAAYLSGKGEIIIEDLLGKLAQWIKLNNKIAQDGVGARPTGHKLTDGTEEVENIYLSPQDRVGYLDQSKGMQAIFDYINRQITKPEPKSKKVKK